MARARRLPQKGGRGGALSGPGPVGEVSLSVCCGQGPGETWGCQAEPETWPGGRGRPSTQLPPEPDPTFPLRELRLHARPSGFTSSHTGGWGTPDHLRAPWVAGQGPPAHAAGAGSPGLPVPTPCQIALNCNDKRWQASTATAWNTRNTRQRRQPARAPCPRRVPEQQAETGLSEATAPLPTR